MQSFHAVTQVRQLPAPSPGFLGPFHNAIEVLSPLDLPAVDPFVLLMDDRISVGPTPQLLGGAHPHAGIETVTLLLESDGCFRDDGEGGDLRQGDCQFMTAGHGVVHGHATTMSGSTRILQLWIRLPKKFESVPPSVQLLRFGTSAVPQFSCGGVRGTVYSGSCGGVTSPTTNYAPVTIVDFVFEPSSAPFDHLIPAGYNSFLYVVEGTLTIPADSTDSSPTQARSASVVWLHSTSPPSPSSPPSTLRLSNASPTAPARCVLFSGLPCGEALVHRGPFVATDYEAIRALNVRFRSNDGTFPSVRELGGKM